MNASKLKTCIYTILLLLFVVNDGNAQVKQVEFPSRYKFQNNDVIMITPLQVRKINKVFLDNENNQRKVLSLEKEVSVLNEALLKRDSSVVYRDKIIEVTNEKEKIYVEQIRVRDEQYDAVIKAHQKEVRQQKVRKWVVGGVSIGVGFAIGTLIGLF